MTRLLYAKEGLSVARLGDGGAGGVLGGNSAFTCVASAASCSAPVIVGAVSGGGGSDSDSAC